MEDDVHTEDQGASLNEYSAVTHLSRQCKATCTFCRRASGAFHNGELAECGGYSRGGPDLIWFRSFAAMLFRRAPGRLLAV